MKARIQDRVGREDRTIVMAASEDVKRKVDTDEKEGVKDVNSSNRVKIEAPQTKRFMKAREYNAERSEELADDVHEYKRGNLPGHKLLDRMAAIISVETSKAFQALTELSGKLESTGILERGGLWESAKAGALYFKGYRIGLGSLLAALVLMKSMHWVITEEDAKNDEASWDSFKKFFKADGREKFDEVGPHLSSWFRTNYDGGGTLLQLNGLTAAEHAARLPALADIQDDKMYMCEVAFNLAGVWIGFQQALSGAQMKAAPYSLTTIAQWTSVAGNIQATPFAAWVGGTYYICTACPIHRAVRSVGALDLPGVVKTAVFLGAAGLNRTIGVLYPFVSNSVGNLFTDAKLPDFIGKE
jgi:hypothetical protein